MKFLILSLVIVCGFISQTNAHPIISPYPIDTFIPGLKFVPVYRDKKNNLSWSASLPGYYTNGCVNRHGDFDRAKCTFQAMADGTYQVKIDDSNAAKNCQIIGARLPTKFEYESLMRDFEYTELGNGELVLTNKGDDDMQAIFRETDEYAYFWTSTPGTTQTLAFFFSRGVWHNTGRSEGSILEHLRYVNGISVRCVSEQ
ncbi:MAG: hypothetical protein IPM97_08420 [Bdellovibrionaceae bacterium]|nr:hypothetical protein [Pseudobdellovibrionaceae bacterium]